MISLSIRAKGIVGRPLFLLCIENLPERLKIPGGGCSGHPPLTAKTWEEAPRITLWLDLSIGSNIFGSGF